MANCPKIKYNGTTIGTLNVGSTEIYNLNDAKGKRIYHKHIEGVCMTHHVGTTNNYCDGTRSVHLEWTTRSDGQPGVEAWLAKDACPKCGNTSGNSSNQNFSDLSQVNIGGYTSGNRYGTERCGKLLSSTPYDYYSYSCGYEGGTTEADITDVTDIVWLRP